MSTEFNPYKANPKQERVFSDLVRDKYIIPKTFHRGIGPQQHIFGIDIAEKGGDKSVIVRGIKDNKGNIQILMIDEYADWPDYKWYRNPLKWLQFKHLMRVIKKSSKGIKIWQSPKT